MNLPYQRVFFVEVFDNLECFSPQDVDRRLLRRLAWYLYKPKELLVITLVRPIVTPLPVCCENAKDSTS